LSFAARPLFVNRKFYTRQFLAPCSERLRSSTRDFSRVNFQIDTANVQVKGRRRKREGYGTVMSEGARVGCIGDLLVEFVCATKNGRHKRAATYSGRYPSGAAGIFIDQAAQVGGAASSSAASATTRSGKSCCAGWSTTGSRRLIRVVKGVPTGTAFVSYNDDGSRDFVYNIVLSAAARFDGRRRHDRGA
jgi:hypothetical protein